MKVRSPLQQNSHLEQAQDITARKKNQALGGGRDIGVPRGSTAIRYGGLDAVQAVAANQPAENIDALLDKFGLERQPKTTRQRIAGNIKRFAQNLGAGLDKLLVKFGFDPAKGSPGKQIGQNLRNLVAGLKEREEKLVHRVVATFEALGLTAIKAGTLDDLSQLKDFAEMSIKAGHPFEALSAMKDVVGYVLKYPDEARKILKFLDRNEQNTWAQKSPWMETRASTPIRPVRENKPLRTTDVAIIGSGLSAAHASRYFADAGKNLDVLVIEKDSKETREHAASLRNAGIICTAMDYIFGIDEAVGKKPIENIQHALKIPFDEAEQVYQTMMQVMREARFRIEDFLRSKNVDVGLSKEGTLDVARTEDEVAAYRRAAIEAQKVGFDWTVVDKTFLKENYGVESKHIAGAMHFRDSGQLNPGKLVKALFDYATAQSRKINVSYDTELQRAEKSPDGKGWILQTSQGPIHAKYVIDAREAFAPYDWREKRFSQIHVVNVPKDSAPMKLGEVNICHSLSYMRKLEDGKYLVGSGDFPIHDTDRTPAPLASIALYSAAHFRKLFPDTPFEIEKVWGGVFGLSPDGIPVAGELADHWHVLGGSGGSGLNVTPVLAKQAVDQITGKTGPMKPADSFSPRRFFVQSLREELAAKLQKPVEQIRVEVLNDAPLNSAQKPFKDGETIVFQIEEQNLDAMNKDVAQIFGSNDQTQRAERRAGWIAKELAAAQQGLAASEAAREAA